MSTCLHTVSQSADIAPCLPAHTNQNESCHGHVGTDVLEGACDHSLTLSLPPAEELMSHEQNSGFFVPIVMSFLRHYEISAERYTALTVTDDVTTQWEDGSMQGYLLVYDEVTSLQRRTPLWRRRWFVIRHNYLYEFHRNNSRDIGIDSIGAVPLEHCVVRLGASSSFTNQWKSTLAGPHTLNYFDCLFEMTVPLAEKKAAHTQLPAGCTETADAQTIPTHPTAQGPKSTTTVLFRARDPTTAALWVGALEEASSLSLGDLYEIEQSSPRTLSPTTDDQTRPDDHDHGQLGVGLFSKVKRARRKKRAVTVSRGGLLLCANGQRKPGGVCALKIIDKAFYWQLVEQQEISICLVREIATQAVLSLSSGSQDVESLPVVRLWDVIEFGDKLVIEMDLMEGGDMFEYLERVGRFKEEEAVPLVYDLIKAVQYCQQRSIAHRDIKLENIVFADKLQRTSPKLADFGMAGFVVKGGLMHRRCGTPGYVAPEVLRPLNAGGYGINVDMFSLGVVCYLLICGYEPFQSHTGNEREVLALNRNVQYCFHPSEWREISAECKEFIASLLKKDPDERFTPEQALQHPWIRRRMAPRIAAQKDISTHPSLPLLSGNGGSETVTDPAPSRTTPQRTMSRGQLIRKSSREFYVEDLQAAGELALDSNKLSALRVRTRDEIEDFENIPKRRRLLTDTCSEEIYDAQAPLGSSSPHMQEMEIPNGSTQAQAIQADSMASNEVIQTAVGCLSIRGLEHLKSNSPNEDRYVIHGPHSSVATVNLLLTCGVFDGHGGRGDVAAELVSTRFFDQLINSLKASGNLNDSLFLTFGFLDGMLLALEPLQSSGTTATVAVLSQPQPMSVSVVPNDPQALQLREPVTLTVANCGDSEAVLFQRSSSGSGLRWVDMSAQHRWTGDEAMRAGGKIENGYLLHPSSNTVISVSRALGDADFTHVGVSPVPSIQEHSVTEEDVALVLASDGIWEQISREEMAKIISQSTNGNSAAQLIAESIRERHKDQAHLDDATIIVVYLSSFNLGQTPFVTASH
eukprot:GILJ01011304.1.p1 GENE.GILJ01011304.1~~GILJ01011304.1.p1  ORF type:complete len:1030 (+),score=135.01 GILJ01011304.1:184-3273(+)